MSNIYRAEEKCLVRCGLVHLLDRLCSLTNYRSESTNSDAQSTRQKVSAMAWAGFQVLSNRCVMWEQEDGKHRLYIFLIIYNAQKNKIIIGKKNP